MSEKHPVWTRTRIGRDRVHWVAYDDRDGAEGRVTVAQGYAPSLREADVAARAALAEAGMYGSRRAPARSGLAAREKAPRQASAEPARAPRREYLYTRRQVDPDGDHYVAAHLVLGKTAAKVRVTRQSCGPDQIGTDDEQWDGVRKVIALDRARLERDGSAYTVSYPDSEFYPSRAKALGDSAWDAPAALGVLGIGAPCTIEDIKAAYRLKALSVHPDRGGNPGAFRAVEDAYRRLLREAHAPGSS